MGANGAGRKSELERDLLVDLALGEPPEHLELARRERAGRGGSAPVERRSGQLVQHLTQVLRVEPHHARDGEQLVRSDRLSLRVVSKHVGESYERRVATACKRKRSGAASQMGVRSKKSNVLVAFIRASTPAGLSTSIASGTLLTLPRLTGCLLATRMTEITSATSDSIAAIRSDTAGCSWLTRPSTRLRDSARAGNPSSASKAAVRRRPCPSL